MFDTTFEIRAGFEADLRERLPSDMWFERQLTGESIWRERGHLCPGYRRLGEIWVSDPFHVDESRLATPVQFVHDHD